MATKVIGVIGASSMVGRFAMAQLVEAGHSILAFSRRPKVQSMQAGVRWVSRSDFSSEGENVDSLPDYWLCFCPIWSLEDYFPLFLQARTKVVVALSSTSKFTKSAEAGAQDPKDVALALRLDDGENQLKLWAGQNSVAWIVLRPTLIYDFDQDRNVSLIASFIRYFGFFPLLGEANGLRQPVFAGDVAKAAIAAMHAGEARNRAYNVAGAEVLSYRAMVERIFKKMGRYPLFLTVPQSGFDAAIHILRFLPIGRKFSGSMATRMNQDMVFDYKLATRDFGYAPRPFLCPTIWKSAQTLALAHEMKSRRRKL